MGQKTHPLWQWNRSGFASLFPRIEKMTEQKKIDQLQEWEATLVDQIPISVQHVMGIYGILGAAFGTLANAVTGWETLQYHFDHPQVCLTSSNLFFLSETAEFINLLNVISVTIFLLLAIPCNSKNHFLSIQHCSHLSKSHLQCKERKTPNFESQTHFLKISIKLFVGRKNINLAVGRYPSLCTVAFFSQALLWFKGDLDVSNTFLAIILCPLLIVTLMNADIMRSICIQNRINWPLSARVIWMSIQGINMMTVFLASKTFGSCGFKNFFDLVNSFQGFVYSIFTLKFSIIYFRYTMQIISWDYSQSEEDVIETRRLEVKTMNE